MATNIYWSGSQPTVFAGPVPPSSPTPFWLDNSSSPYTLNFWLDAPEYSYAPLGTVDPVTNQFIPSGTAGAGTLEYHFGTSAPSSIGQAWVDTSVGTATARPVMHFINGSWVQVGWYNTVSSSFASYAPELNDSYQTSSLAAVSDPQEGDKAWLTAGAVWTEHLFLNGVWVATGDSFDSVTNSFNAGGGSATPLVEEWQTASSLPLAGGDENVIWLEAGSSPNRTWSENIQLGGSWVATGRTYSEATGGFLAAASAIGLAVFHQQEARGTGGGAIAAGAWRDRPLNSTQFNNLAGVSLNSTTGVLTVSGSASRKFLVDATAAAGFYETAALRSRHHQLRVVDGGNNQMIIGHSHFEDNFNGSAQLGSNDYALLNGVVTVPAGGGSLKLQHAFNFAPDTNDSEMGTSVGNGFNLAGYPSVGGPEVFASIKLTEIA